MIIQVPPEGIYDVPEGTFRAVCVKTYEIFQPLCNPSRRLRIVWELPDLKVDGIPCRVHKIYNPSLDTQSSLRKDLQSWFGMDLKSGTFDSETLVGKQATVTVKHHLKQGHARPARKVIGIEPPVTVEAAQGSQAVNAG